VSKRIHGFLIYQKIYLQQLLKFMIMRFSNTYVTIIMTEFYYYAFQEGDFHPAVFLRGSEATFREPVIWCKLSCFSYLNLPGHRDG
jgi:hypothetical protein